MMKELENKVNFLMSTQEVRRTGILCPYPRECDSIPYLTKFNLINFMLFDGKGSSTQHLIYFKSHLGVISENESLMIQSFVGTLRGAAFDWYRRLKLGNINCWDDMESSFLNNFFDDNTEVSIGALLEEKQKDSELVDSFVKHFRNKAMNCKDPIIEEFILQTYHNNLSIDVLEVMGVVPLTTWKELKLHGEQVECFLKRKGARERPTDD
ncbi:uncharacterized protein LOC109823536 [Asparagus officinalis]|uniref:uncharacterized protein LOC109823536 n=1 Tax=Asparagus officinalis TaxID=4686 RepID=UPI00098DE726|nr:uncharacterized protein LOC109823536 [Asparagus officinalis]